MIASKSKQSHIAAVVSMEAQFGSESIILTKSAFLLSPKQLVKVILENGILLSAMICFRTASKVQPLSTRANVDLPSIRMFTYCNLLMKNSGRSILYIIMRSY